MYNLYSMYWSDWSISAGKFEGIHIIRVCGCFQFDLSLLSRAMAQMVLQRWSKLRLVSCRESLSASVPPVASSSRSKTSHRLSTDAMPSVCCSMSLCSSWTDMWTDTKTDLASVHRSDATYGTSAQACTEDRSSRHETTPPKVKQRTHMNY